MNDAQYDQDVTVAELSARIKNEFNGKERLLLFDRDGTLVPFAEVPSKAVVDNELKALLMELSLKPATVTGVISARGLAQLTTDFGNRQLVLAGNYGLGIYYPDGYCEIQPQAAVAQPEIMSAYNKLQEILGHLPGIILENHGLTLCLHTYRVKDEKKLQHIKSVMQDLQVQHSLLKVRSLSTSYEVLPQLVWDKAYALSCIQKHLFGDDFDRLYLFAGDTEYDEPGFSWVNHHGGISIRISPAGTPTAANFILDSPQLLRRLIRELAA